MASKGRVKRRNGARHTDTSARDKYVFRSPEQFALDRDCPVPLYQQVKQILFERVSEPEMIGRLLPSEPDLASMFGVSRMTVRRALDDLASNGLLTRRRKLGTRVSRQSLLTEDLVRLSSYTEQAAAAGSSTRTQLLDVRLHLPDELAQERLQLSEGEQTLCLKRLRGTQELFPVAYLHSEIPARFGIGPDEDFSSSLYRLFESKHNIPVVGAHQTIRAAKATPEQAKLLGVSRGACVLMIEGITFTTGGVPLELVRGVYRPDRYQFSVYLKR